MWFIDTDNIIRVEGLRNVVTGNYVNDATITGILYELPALNPDVAAAVSKAGGKVGILCAGHGRAEGDHIRMERSQNYNADYTLDALTSANELVVTATYVAETFTGEEFIYIAVETTPIPVTFSYEAASSGNYVGKIAYTENLLQGLDYVLCIKEVSGSEQVLAKVIQTAGFQGL